MTEDESLRLCTEASPKSNTTKNSSSLSMTSPLQNNLASKAGVRLNDTKNENSKAGTSKDYSTEPRPGIAPKDSNNDKDPSFASTASSKSNSPVINGHKMYSSSTTSSSFTSPTTTTYKKINNHLMPEAARQSDESNNSSSTIHAISNGFSGLKTKDDISSSTSNNKMNGDGSGSNGGENGIICNSNPSCSKKIDEKIDNRFKCPHTDKFLTVAFPEFSAKHRQNIEELIIDDMSLIIFKSMEDYKTFKIYEDKRRAKLEKVKKEKEESEIMRLAALKKEKLKSKYDAQKEKRKEKNRIQKEQRTQEKRERRERRERMRHSSQGTNEFKLTKIERRQWKIEYLQRKQERAERREAKIKKQQEDKLRKEQSLSESLKSTNGTPVVATTVAAVASASIETLSSTIVASASSVAASVTTGLTPTSSLSSSSTTTTSIPTITNPPPPSLPATPCSSRINSTNLMNDFSNSNIATEALATLANISSGGGGNSSTTPQRLKRSANDNSDSSPTINNRMNGVIFSPATKIPKLESISHSSVVKSEPNETSRGVPLRSNIPNGLFKTENLPPGFDPTLFGSLPPSTPTTAPPHSNNNTNDFSAAIATGTSKAAAQVATFMRNSQAPQLEIHQALAQNPQLALIFHQALAAMHQAVEPDPRNNPMGIADTKPSLQPPSLHQLHGGNFPLHLPPGMPTLPPMNIPSSVPSTTPMRPPVPAPSQFPVTSSSVAPPPPVSTKPSIPFSTATPTPTVSKAFNIGPLEAAVPPMPNKLPLPPIGIQFPPDASLGSQLAGAAMLAQQQQQQQQQQHQNPSTSSSSQPSHWCNKHVTIAHNICNRIKAEQAKAAANEQQQQQRMAPPPQIQRPPEPQSRQNIRLPPPSSNSIMPPPPTPQKQISNRGPLPPTLPPPNAAQQTMLHNLAMQNAQLLSQNPAFAQWLPRFPPPLPPSAAPGITSGIPLQQNSAVNDFASQELAKLYRLNQSIKQEQPGTSSARPPSHIERSGSVAPGALSTAGQSLPQVPTSMFMNQTPNPLLSANPLTAFAAQPNLAQSLAGLMHPGSAESILFSMLQQKQQLHQQQQQQQQMQQNQQQQNQQQFQQAQQQHQQQQHQQQQHQQQAQQQHQQQQQQQQAQQQAQAQAQQQQQLQLQQQLQQQQQQLNARMANPLQATMLNQLNSPFASHNAGVRPPAMTNNPFTNLFASLERERLAGISMQSPQLGMPRAPFSQQNLGAQSAANALQQMLRASEQQPATSQSPFLTAASAGGLPNHATFDLNAAAQFLPQLAAQNSLLHAGNPLMRPPFHFLNNVSQAQAQNLLNMQSFGKMSFPPTQPNNNTKRDP